MTKEECASKLHLLQQEVEHLQRWKEEAKLLLNPIFEYAEKHPDMKIGGSMTEFVLNRCKEYDKLKKDIEGYELKEAFDALDYSNLSEKIVAYQQEYDKLKGENEALKETAGKFADIADAIIGDNYKNDSGVWESPALLNETFLPYLERALAEYNSTNNQTENNGQLS